MSFLFGALCLQSSQRFPKMLGQRKVHAHPEHANERSGRRAAPSLTPSLWPSLSPHSQVDAAFVQWCAYLRDASRAHPSFGAVHTCLYPIGPLPLTERRLAYPHQNPLQVPSFVEPSGHYPAKRRLPLKGSAAWSSLVRVLCSSADSEPFCRLGSQGGIRPHNNHIY